MPLFPWHRLVTCSHLLLSCGASFACLFVVLSPSGTPVLVVFGRAFLALCLFVVFSLFPFLLWLLCVVFGLWVFLPAFLRLSSLWPLCAASCVVGLLPPLFVWFVCCWFCCVVRWLPPPAGCCLPPPHRLFPCGVLVQFLCWSLPLGIWLLHATARLPCLNAWGVVVLCFLASFCFMAAKAFGPVWGFVLPSTPWCICCCGALCSCTEVFIFG